MAARDPDLKKAVALFYYHAVNFFADVPNLFPLPGGSSGEGVTLMKNSSHLC